MVRLDHQVVLLLLPWKLEDARRPLILAVEIGRRHRRSSGLDLLRPSLSCWIGVSGSLPGAGIHWIFDSGEKKRMEADLEWNRVADLNGLNTKIGN